MRIGGLLIAILIVIAIFTFLSKPNTFLTVTNALGIMRSMSTIAIVALGLTLVIVVGEIDLSFGFVYGLASILIGVAWIVWGWPIWAAIILAFAAAATVGTINAFLVTVLKIPSFIVTLGTGQLVFGTTLLVSNTATLNPAYPPVGQGRAAGRGRLVLRPVQPGPAIRPPDAGDLDGRASPSSSDSCSAGRCSASG